MPTAHDLDPPSMTEEERLTKRRFESNFAFEMMHPAISRAQFGRDEDDDG